MKEVGFNPWLDIYNLRGGELWDEQINHTIKQADFFLACLSKESVAKRGYIQNEFKRALELWESKLNSDIFVIPVKLDDCEIPPEFKKFHWIDHRNSRGLLNIARSIEEGLKRRHK